MRSFIGILKFCGVILLTSLSLSCSPQEFWCQDTLEDTPSVIRFAASYPLLQTRADEYGFAGGDMMGIYVVDYEDGSPGVLQVEGNRADNVRYTYNATSMSWDGAKDIYWKDNKTSVDIYGYYPYDSKMASVEDYKFSVSARQDLSSTEAGLGGYEASDILWAKCENLRPTSDPATLTYGHLMAGIMVNLQMGDGFDSSEWAGLDKTVLITNTVCDASIDLSRGSVTPVEQAASKTIVPYMYNGQYRAVVVPQSIAAGTELFNITVGGVVYSYSRKDTMPYTSGKLHKFTIRVDKRSMSGNYGFTIVEESITSWLEDYDFHDGIVREYLVIEVDEPGMLEMKIRDSGRSLENLRNLKITGPLNRDDLRFIGETLSATLMALNMKEVVIVGNEEERDVLDFGSDLWRTGMFQYLNHFVFPDKLRKIADCTFCRAALVGSLVIPEGVEEIGVEAFAFCPLTGTLELPSSLKIIRGGAFAWTNLRGSLILPEGLEIIGPNFYGGQNYGAFDGTSFTGLLHLPSSLVSYGKLLLPGVTGDIVVPDNVTEITDEAHMNSACTSVTIPEGVKVIGNRAFTNSAIIGEVHLPSTCREIGENSFSQTKIRNIVFPEGLSVIGYEAFRGCDRLSGTITLPEKIFKVSKRTFEGCSMLSGIVLSENIKVIDREAFKGCHNLESIVCLAEEPPYVGENAFDGVPRDNFTLEVPAGSVDKYKRAEGWKEFKRISEYRNFVCRPATACALNSTLTKTLVLNADGPWTVSYLPEWCSVSPQEGNGKTQISLTIDPMDHGAAHRTDSVVFTLEDGGYKTWCKVSQYDYKHEENEVITLQKATRGNGIDVIFLGDGWDGEAISSGSYLSLVQEQMEHFFGLEPYTTYRDYFNVYVGIALSQETGVNTLNTYRDTRFETIYGGGGCNGVEPHLAVEKRTIFDYVTRYSPILEENLSRSLVILVPNTTDYGGCSYLYDDGSAISVCCPSAAQYPSDTRGIIQHEAGGHGFGKLADEKIITNLFADNGTKATIEYYHQKGWYLNVATSGKMSDVPRSYFIFDPEYSDNVDVFEGAMGFTRGVWRSEQNSCMNYGIPYYNAISRQEIVRRILDYSGEGFTMEKFYEKDSKEWGSGTMARSTPSEAYVNNNWHSVPVVE
jgi:hypothetical protein